MVQGRLKKAASSLPAKKVKQKGTAFVSRKAAPTLVRDIGPNHRTTAAIGRKIESVMAARLTHEGGTLNIIRQPNNVDRYEKGRARTTEKQSKALFASSMARRARMKQQGLPISDMNKNVNDKTTLTGKKRKKGLVGVTQVGDDWFDEADRELEEIKYESEEGEDEEGRSESEQQPILVNRSEKIEIVDGNNNRLTQQHDTRNSYDKCDDDVMNVTKRAKSLLGNWLSNANSNR